MMRLLTIVISLPNGKFLIILIFFDNIIPFIGIYTVQIIDIKIISNVISKNQVSLNFTASYWPWIFGCVGIANGAVQDEEVRTVIGNAMRLKFHPPGKF